MPPTDHNYLISEPRQLEALISPVRQEIVDALSELGGVSVSDLATALGRAADGLYYHLRILKNVGLVVSRSQRQCGDRQEEVIALVARNLRVQYAFGGDGNAKVLAVIVAAMLRLTIRDYTAAVEKGEARVDGAARELLATRRILWLTRQELAAVNAVIETLRQRATTKRRRHAQLYALTMLLTPLRHGADGGPDNTEEE